MTRRSKHIRSRRAGFTLIELMVALTIGAMVIATVYTIGASASRHFQEQQRISQLQLSVRLALDRVRRDVQRAGFHGTMNSAIDRFCGTPPSTQIRGLNVTHPSPRSFAALSTMPGYTAATSHGDILDITGNFRTGEAFVVREWEGTNLQLATNFLSYRRTFTANPTEVTSTIDTDLVQQTFAPGTTLMARLGGGMRIWTRVSSVSANTVGTNASIITNTAPNCRGAVGMEGWAQGGVTVAPVTLVRYEIANAAEAYGTAPIIAGLAPRNPAVTGTNTVLMRTEFDPMTMEIIDGPAPLLEYAVHFDVDVFADTGLSTAPSRIQLFDDAAAANQTFNNPATVRGVRISIAARTPEQDAHLSTPIASLGDGTPRVFRVFDDRGGAARVRSAYTEVFLPNSSFR